MSIMIIAEAGVNHNGSVEIAKRLIDAAKSAGADCIKFQTFIAEQIVSVFAKMAEYQKKHTGTEVSQLEMLRKLELSFQDFIILKEYCEYSGIIFLSTPFDMDSIKFLENLNIGFWKIPSGEITNYPYLVRISKTHKPVILSTGMCEMHEIDAAMKVLQDNGSGLISLLHCTTEYPAPYVDVNLKAMTTLRDRFNVPVGYSDHTEGIEISIAAAALGASIIEKHFTLDRNMIGPDHQSSLDPQSLKNMISAIRNVEIALGSGEKRPAESEIKNIVITRKSIIAKRSINKGELFTEDNLTTKRPGNGISPMKWNDLLGQVAYRDFEKDELIEC